MKALTPGILFVGLILSTSMPFAAWSQDKLHVTDPAELLSAIEDYRFSDFDLAISKLKKLRRTHPDNLRLLQYLGLAYEESERFHDAISVYRDWLKKSGDPYAADARFAHVGIANALLKNRDYLAAAEQLKVWLARHPEDRSSQLLYGDLLIKNNKLDAAKAVWQGLLANQDASGEQRAAAYYYLAWIAYLNDDLERAKTQAGLSLAADAEGPYAKPAQQLLVMKAARRFSASISLEEFYTSNVELLPDYVSSSGRKNADSATQAGLTLAYNFPSFLMTYAYNASAYAKRSDFDTSVHALSATWRKADWTIVPHYEYVRLSNEFLYDGLGVDVSWAYTNWSIGYGAMFKQFSSGFSVDPALPANDLSRLGGVANSFTLTRQGESEDLKHSFTLGLIDEATKGDASHDKTDSYQQLFAAASLTGDIGPLDSGASFNIYTRKYGKADAQANGLVRQDQHVQLSAFVLWQPWQDNHELGANVSWQQNSSNYNKSNVPLKLAKEFSAWRTGLSWSYRW